MIKKVVSVFLSLAIIFLAAGFAAYAEDKNMIFVSPSGNDNSSGTIDAPLATLSAAKEKAKNFDGALTVYFREGTYTINDTRRSSLLATLLTIIPAGFPLDCIRCLYATISSL